MLQSWENTVRVMRHASRPESLRPGENRGSLCFELYFRLFHAALEWPGTYQSQGIKCLFDKEHSRRYLRGVLNNVIWISRNRRADWTGRRVVYSLPNPGFTKGRRTAVMQIVTGYVVREHRQARPTTNPTEEG